jgi:hypothetical protein
MLTSLNHITTASRNPQCESGTAGVGIKVETGADPGGTHRTDTRSPGFVDEHQAQRIEVRLGVEPGLAPSGGVGPLLLAGVCRFF